MQVQVFKGIVLGVNTWILLSLMDLRENYIYFRWA